MITLVLEIIIKQSVYFAKNVDNEINKQVRILHILA